MKNTLAVLSAAFFLHSGPAFAQTTPDVNPAAAAAARDLLTSMHYRDVTIAGFHQMERSFPEMMRAQLTGEINSDAGMTAADKSRALVRMEAALPRLTAALHRMLSDPGLVDEMMEAMIPLYARNFTVDEIHQIAAFYQSPVGQKTLKNMPAIMSESVMLGQKLVTPRVQKMMQEMMRETNP